MATYTLTPNKRTICLSVTPELLIGFDEAHPNYQPESIPIYTYWEPFVDEYRFKINFNKLLIEHKLIEYYDDLLYLILTEFDQMWLEISKYCALREVKSRVEKLTKITDLLCGKHGKLQSLSLKTLTDFEEVNDSTLKKWMQTVLLDAVTNQNYPGWTFKEGLLFILPTEEYVYTKPIIGLDSLRDAKDLKLIPSQTYIRQQHVNFFTTICKYLNIRTPLKAKVGTQFSNAQLRFCFDLLVLLKQIHPSRIKTIKSPHESYMRGFLMNVIKRKPTKRNKSICN